MSISRRLSYLAVILVLAGCSASSAGSAGASVSAPSTAPSTAAIVAPSASAAEGAPSTSPASGSNASGGPVDLPPATIGPVITDAAARAGVTPDKVTVVSAEAVTFPDGGLGCPEPGMAYTQALVDGFMIILEANGKTFDYRGTGTGFRLCTETPS